MTPKTRMLYDRVRKSKICFEITAFLNYERGISRAGEFKTSNVNNKKKLLLFSFDVLNSPALEIPRS